MNYGISILFRAIPLFMAAFCFCYGLYVWLSGNTPDRLTAGPVIFFLGSICIALFTTAATIIRQIIGKYTVADKYLLPTIGDFFAFGTVVCGGVIMAEHASWAVVPGHVVCGLGLITACVATAATASTRFSLIPENSADATMSVNPQGFSYSAEITLVSIVTVISAVAWVWAIGLIAWSDDMAHTVAGCVMGGIACVCTSLIALVASIARQVRGSYSMTERKIWYWVPLTMGAVAFAAGLYMIFSNWGEPVDFVGFVLIGLALICWSISSKVILLAKIWHTEFELASRIPIIPVITALTCMFMAAFLFEEALFKPKFFVPSRVLMGFGAICFTLYSIVSILESGAKSK